MLNKELINKKNEFKQYLSNLWVDVSVIKDENLMITAFVHKSYASDYIDEISYNERLEFLGDSILWATISHMLFEYFKDKEESTLTLYKIALVREETLAEVARDIWLDKMVVIWKWEEKLWGRKKDAILSDVFEAILGYLFIDFWFEVAYEFVKNFVFIKIPEKKNIMVKSPKTILQEYVQRTYGDLPKYEDYNHEVDDKWNIIIFKTVIYINWKVAWEWYGQSKRKAQEDAAIGIIKRLWIKEQE